MIFARPHRQAKSNTTSRLSGLQPDDRRNRQPPRIQERYAPSHAGEKLAHPRAKSMLSNRR